MNLIIAFKHKPVDVEIDDNTRILHVFEMWIGMNLHIYGLIIHPINKLLPVGLIAQLVEHCNGIAEVRVRIPVQAFLAAAKAGLKCDDEIHS